jgi:hypothetical protein
MQLQKLDGAWHRLLYELVQRVKQAESPEYTDQAGDLHRLAGLNALQRFALHTGLGRQLALGEVALEAGSLKAPAKLDEHRVIC